MAQVFDLEYREQGQSGSTLLRDLSSTSQAVTGLTSETTYEYRVRSGGLDGGVRTIGLFSAWATFTTSAPPDTIKPTITLIGDADITLTESQVSGWTDPGATATDNVDGDISNSIVVTGTVSASIGTYSLEYDVVDSAGNAADTVTRTVTVINDETTPVVTLVGAKVQRIPENGTWVDPGATASDGSDGDLTASIVVTQDIDPTTPGVYYATYSVTNSWDNTGSATRIVIVDDEITPSDYEIEIRPLFKASEPVITTGLVESHELTSLTAGTPFEWRIRAIGLSSGASVFSEWTDWQGFATLAVGDDLTPRLSQPVLDGFTVTMPDITIFHDSPELYIFCSDPDAQVTIDFVDDTTVTYPESNEVYYAYGDCLGVARGPDELLPQKERIVLAGDAQESGLDSILITA